MDEADIVALLVARARELGVDASTDGKVQQRIEHASRLAAVELRVARTTEVNLPFLAANESGPVHLLVTLPPTGRAGGEPLGARLDLRVKIS